MTEELEVDIAIVGGGIIGLALARCLRESPLRLALIDAGPAPARPGADAPPAGVAAFDARVSALTPVSESLLRELGAWERIRAEGACPFREMRVWDADGTGAVHFSAADIHREALGHIAENRAILAALDEDLRQQDNLRLLRPEKVAGITAQGHLPGAAPHRLGLEGERAVSARLLVGADGAASLVRRGLGFPVQEWDYGHRAIVATVRTESPHRYTAWQRFMPSGPLALLPLLDPRAGAGGEQCYSSIVWSCREGLAEELMQLDEAAFERRLEAAFERRLGRVTGCGPRFAFPLRQLHAVDYVRPGVALVGDAAHTIHPLAGQGVNLGLSDVAVLAQVIAQAHARGEDFAALRALSRYQRRRKGQNLGMMAAMEGFKRLFESDDLLVRWLRNTGFSAVDGLPMLKQQFMRQAMGLSSPPK